MCFNGCFPDASIILIEEEYFGMLHKYRARRIENLEETEDLSWWTIKEKDQASKELLHFLKQPDPETREYRDIRWMYFRRKVLDKYRNNKFCEIGSNYISFLSSDDKKESASTLKFNNRNFVNIDDVVLMMQAQD
jgi:hypothetical protein